MRRPERACIITQVLTENPNKDYSLGDFAEMLGCAKSSISEDIKLIKTAIAHAGFGYVETSSGSRGGVRYVPHISDEKAAAVLEEIKARLEEPDRILGRDLLYTSDVMFDHGICRGAAAIFARHFSASGADLVLTVEMKGIAVAMFTAEFLNLPLVVIRRESRISDGSTLSVNFFSGSTGRIEKMSLPRRALKPDTKALIIDDYIKDGGSIRGIEGMLTEFDCSSAGTGVIIASESEISMEDCFPLLIMEFPSPENCNLKINPELTTSLKKP